MRHICQLHGSPFGSRSARSAFSALGLRLPIVLCVFSLALASCAQLVVDPDGTRHVTGLVRLDIPPPQAAPAGETVQLRVVGIALTRSPNESSLAIGFADDFHTLVPRDSCIALTGR